MRHISFVTAAPGQTAAELYPVLRDFERYPALTKAVRSVTIHRADADLTVSSWEVNFRGGILRWTEEDRFDPATWTITFHQTAGDVERFDGTWRLEDAPDGCRVYFDADLDLGIPALGSILEPIAERALKDNIEAILLGLFAAPRSGDEAMARAA
jgi:ribosome-associated toxin RatA of RatAB toxin-antitoxin module